MDITSAETKATYDEIKKYVAEHNAGMKVSNLYISHFDLDDIQWDNNAKEYAKRERLMNEKRYYKKYYIIMMSG